MKIRHILRLLSLLMLVAAMVFLAVALTHPEMGTAFYIGPIVIGAPVWRVCYLLYAAAMVAMFIASFIVKEKK